jgi:DNA polymerase III subunit delta
MSDAKPTVYILHGDDREEIETRLHDFIARMGEPDMAEMNISRLDGKTSSLNDLRSAALAIPFLTERRLVIVEDALSPYSGQDKKLVRKDFLELMESLPQTTALVLVIPDSRRYRKGAYEWETLKDKHWLIDWAQKHSQQTFVMDCALPTDAEMVSWVKAKVTELGGSFTPPAVSILVDYVGNNTQRAAQEITKLLTYVNFDRPVDDNDVQQLTAQEQQANIFDMVDAIGDRNAQTALKTLHILLEESDVLPLFGMIVRQFRLLLQARELLDSGDSPDTIARTLKQHPYVAQKITRQAHHFDLPTLESIYHQLLKIDVDGKAGRMDVGLALDVLIAYLAS